MKIGDIVVLSIPASCRGFMVGGWEGFPCRVRSLEASFGADKILVDPLRPRPDMGTESFRWFAWPKADVHPARKVVRLRKTCQAAGISLCALWQPILERFEALDEVVAYVNEGPGVQDLDSLGSPSLLTRAQHARWLMWALRGYDPLPNDCVGLTTLGVGWNEDALSPELVTEFKTRLEALSDKLGTTEYVRCGT